MTNPDQFEPKVEPGQQERDAEVEITESGGEEFQPITDSELKELASFEAGTSSPELQESWERLENTNGDEYNRLRDIEARRKEELESKTPPVRFRGEGLMSFSEASLREMSMEELRDLRAQTLEFMERWDALSEEEKQMQLGRVYELKGQPKVIKLASELGLNPGALQQEETALEAGVRIWGSNLEHQVRTIEEMISKMETEEKETGLEQARQQAESAYAEQAPKEAAEEAEEPAAQEEQRPGLFGRFFGRKKK